MGIKYDTKHNTHHIIGCTGLHMWPLILVQLLLDIISTWMMEEFRRLVLMWEKDS